jgi:bacillithiol biosynthesis cysteine-adding enzyme BshC
MNLNVQPLVLQGPELCRAYNAGEADATSFYLAGSANDPDSYQSLADRIRAETPQSRWQAIGDAFRPAHEPAAEKLREVVEHGGLFVATGQQAGLFVSPLFTLYKAFTAARLAEKLTEQLSVPVMALFSVASEDHDWAEVDHTYIVDVQNLLVRLSLPGPGGDEPGAATPPVERIELTPDIEETFDHLVQLTPESEFKASILEPLRSAYRPGALFAGAFQAALAHLLRSHPFLVVRTADPYVKGQARDLLWAEWQRRDESDKRLRSRAESLIAAGFEVQVPVKPGTTNLFLDGPLGRDRLTWEGNSPTLRRAGERLTEEDLQHVLDLSPHRVSPGALFRPVTEARAFPVIAHVGGPSEIAYLAQSQVLFDLHGIPAPVVVPRASFLLVEPKVARVLEKHDLKPGDLAGDPNVALRRILSDMAPPDLQVSLSDLRQSVAEGLDRVETAAVEFDPGAKSLIGSGKQAIFGGIKALESKLQARVREKHRTSEQQIEKAAVNLYPEGRPQERLLNPYPYLVRYGEGLLDVIYASVVTPLG